MATHRTWRSNTYQGEPYWLRESTEEAESTITNPMTQRTATRAERSTWLAATFPAPPPGLADGSRGAAGDKVLGLPPPGPAPPAWPARGTRRARPTEASPRRDRSASASPRRPAPRQRRRRGGPPAARPLGARPAPG